MTIQGSHISGENVTIEAKDDVNIIAAQDTQNTKGSNKSSGGSIGVTIGLTTGQTSVGVSINGGKGKNRGDGVENIESTIDARDTLTIISGGDTNVIGSQVKGDTVKMEVEGNLSVVSLQDTDNYKEKQTNWSASASTTGAVSGSYSNQKINSEYKSVNEQAGIFAGEGGFDIHVGGNTNLVGGVIASEATPDKNKLSTDTITYSNIKNEAEWSTSTTGAGFSSGGENAQGKNKGLSPIIGGKDGEDSSITKSAIAPGEIEVRSDPNKDLSNLSRDTTNANDKLDPIFDKDKILEKEQAQAIFGEISAEAIGKLSDKMRENAKNADDYNKWADGGEYKILLHTLAGGLSEAIGGGDITSGALGAGVNEYVHRYLSNNEEYGKLDHGTRQIIAGILGGLVTQALTGNGKAGAETAINAEKNNHEIITLRIAQVIGVRLLLNGIEIEKAGRTLVNGVEMLIVYAKNGEIVGSMNYQEAVAKGMVQLNNSGEWVVKNLNQFPNASEVGLIEYDNEGYMVAVSDELGNMIPYMPVVVYYGPHLLPVSKYDNTKADKVAQELGYKDAHDFKKENIPEGEDKVGAHWDIAIIKATNQIVLVRKLGGKILETGHRLIK